MRRVQIAQRILISLIFGIGVFAGGVVGSGGTNPDQSQNNAANSGSTAADLLPDIIIRESDLLDHDIVTNIAFGHRHLRLSNGTPNIGDGPLHLRGLGNVLGGSGNTQDVNQRIYREDSTYWERLAGKFLYHPQHNHIHVEDWCIYRLREVLPGNGVGDIVAEGGKTSFCILDLNVYDSNLPHFDPNGFFFSCGNTVQGLSVGWVDIYTKDLEGQNIDITDLPDGIYWLESVADPEDHFLEKDETNNTTRIQIVIGSPQSFIPDAYEPDNTFDSVDARVLGGPNSPLLGPCNPIKVIPDLGIHEAGNVDIFKFYCNNFGTTADSVSISFQHSIGDLDLQLLNSSHAVLAQSDGNSNSEKISLAGRPRGWYYVKVYGYLDAINYSYTLTINPPVNSPPTVNVTSQVSGVEQLIRGFETANVTWTSSDPELDERWVTVWMNRQPTNDSNAIMIPTTLHTPAAAQFLVVNTSYLDTGTYYVGISITDGGTTTWDWSSGTVYLWDMASLGEIHGTVRGVKGAPLGATAVEVTNPQRIDSSAVDGTFQFGGLFPATYDLHFSCDGYADTTLTGLAIGTMDTLDVTMMMRSVCGYEPGDINNDSKGPNILDVIFLASYLFGGGQAPPIPQSAELDGAPGTNILDVIYLAAYLFSGGPAPLCH